MLQTILQTPLQTLLQSVLQTLLPVQLESSRAIVSCQGLQHVYLFLASMFGQAPANHAAMLQRLNVSERNSSGTGCLASFEAAGSEAAAEAPATAVSMQICSSEST
jgi:hypothetical protein